MVGEATVASRRFFCNGITNRTQPGTARYDTQQLRPVCKITTRSRNTVTAATYRCISSYCCCTILCILSLAQASTAGSIDMIRYFEVAVIPPEKTLPQHSLRSSCGPRKKTLASPQPAQPFDTTTPSHSFPTSSHRYDTDRAAQ